MKIYVIDTSALIDMKIHTPMDIHISQWNMVKTLISSKRLVAPMEVKEEIANIDDELYEWTRNNAEMFIDITTGQISAMREIMDKFPSLPGDNREHSADPWIIALAMDLKNQTSLDEEREIIVVTHEKLKGNKVKIPFVCKHFGIRYMTAQEMFREEGSVF